MTKYRLEPFFLESPAGRLFLLLRAPAEAEHCVLFVPPFAEEMNKSRRQITQTAKALVDKGYAVVVFDLSGTGDSEGDFSDATWETWKANFDSVMAWAEGANLHIDALVATRLGCSLAAESLQESGRTVLRTVFWQPVESGRQFMTQFLRLRVAASMMEADSKETVDGLRRRLDEGESLDIAGYTVSASLFRSLYATELKQVLNPLLGTLKVIEIGRSQDCTLSPAGQRLVEAAIDQGVLVAGARIPGGPFWASTEIVTNQVLTDLTIDCLTAETES